MLEEKKRTRGSPVVYYIMVSLLSAALLIEGCIGIHKFQHSSLVDKSKSRITSAAPAKVEVLDPQNVEELQRLGLTPQQVVQVTDSLGKTTQYHGRFLHITDMHPDPLFRNGSSMRELCHRKSSGDDQASPYGDAMSGCDSPELLVEETLNWISKNLKDKIDFVIWTGDNIRHDNDRRNPRLEMDIFDLNQQVADLVSATFMEEGDENILPLDRRIKIIPSLGNNDVYPHNLFSPGPTLQTRELFKIWRNFVPAEQMHVFDRGAYFFTEVIPGKLVVMSINTLYLFRSNPLVDNCDSRKQPGFMLFQWLGVALKELRKKGMKVWLTGHVPPTPKNYEESCLAKHIVWLYEYRDIIIGGVYGHMNIDHFMTLDSVRAYKNIKTKMAKKGVLLDIDENYFDFNVTSEELNDDEETTFVSHRYDGAPNGKVAYLESVRDDMYSLVKGPKKYGVAAERYTVAHISTSIIPTYNPGMRVWEYNITGLFDSSVGKGEVAASQSGYAAWSEVFDNMEKILAENDEVEEEDEDQYWANYKASRDKSLPLPMPKGTPLGPGYVPQLFSPVRYAQYFLNLSYYSEHPEEPLDYKLEYTTDKQYGMKSLVAKEWIQLARTMAKTSSSKAKTDDHDADAEDQVDASSNISAEKLWEKYIAHAFVSSGYQQFEFAK
ncbi:unnamed protein product [Kuraishia capsulata CBS 1993]|uniref:Endopolyphosphatase n=1 Tax=Kuraishia capsulata CBS 1993 TaxID=1382522 RepID=W6MGT6_9ASCO|nr:uncharacterized protein KUCA_T00000780001 [Kuraishia capsulata CBS 1993]CDK24813.1 unnamed protein product [Kuraishia capsulata CBS 1993]